MAVNIKTGLQQKRKSIHGFTVHTHVSARQASVQGLLCQREEDVHLISRIKNKSYQ